MESLETYTETIEKLLVEQQKENKRILKIQRIQSLILLALVVVFTAGILILNLNVQQATQGIPELVETTTQTVKSTSQEFGQLLEQLNSLDFEELARTIEQAGKSVDAIDVETLNESIQSLHQVTESLANLFNF